MPGQGQPGARTSAPLPSVAALVVAVPFGDAPRPPPLPTKTPVADAAPSSPARHDLVRDAPRGPRPANGAAARGTDGSFGIA